MNRELKRISALVVIMFISLFVASSVIQVFQTDPLAADARNTRARDDSYQVQRGQILLADGKAIVTSKPDDDEYRFQRTYLQPKLYAAVTGYSPVNGQATGIEAALDQQLAGTGGASFFDRLRSTITGHDPQGDSVQLTIDPTVQQAAASALGTRRGAVVALNPKTGAVLAMVSSPSFDPNVIAAHDQRQVIRSYDKLVKADPSPLVNRATAGALNPPGSTFKLIVTSAALESGKYTVSSSFPSPNTLRLPGTNTVIANSDGEQCGTGKTTTLATALRLSCNIPFAELGDRLGAQAISDMATKYGFGQRIEIPVPVTPSVYPLNTDPAVLAQSAFGQSSVQASDLQMAMVSAAIANGGVLMKPNLVQKILSPSLDTVQQMTPQVLSRPVSAATAQALKTMMVSSVADGTGVNARMDGVDVAGKTGTAQNGPTKPYTLWFTGFAPADDPQVAVSVVVENGGGLGQTGTGNSVAAPIAKAVLEAVVNR
ncbi:peptidoglycan D,D-transpeptidase FtsI family protein [uncultured Amnibacterium sp.]|uniref:peptidoglycan D,D-transpeptidase FtsI family protein n=1 Tax=uncultured Amnibacterium sp. TaxID=1631851 RepID=UPI0035C9C4C4